MDDKELRPEELEGVSGGNPEDAAGSAGKQQGHVLTGRYTETAGLGLRDGGTGLPPLHLGRVESDNGPAGDGPADP